MIVVVAGVVVDCDDDDNKIDDEIDSSFLCGFFMGDADYLAFEAAALCAAMRQYFFCCNAYIIILSDLIFKVFHFGTTAIFRCNLIFAITTRKNSNRQHTESHFGNQYYFFPFFSHIKSRHKNFNKMKSVNK